MTAMLRTVRLVPSLLLLSAPVELAHADAPPPSQALASDPTPPRPSLGLSADAAAIVLGDYAARLDVVLVPALTGELTAGASRRRMSDDVLLEVGVSAWFLATALEGPHLTALVGLAWAGPWSQEESLVVRVGGEAGWQFLWETLSISLAAGAHVALDAEGEVGIEPRARAALGIVF